MNVQNQPFSGLVVLDCTHVLAGPYATYQLALLGADVIKIEPPHQPDCSRGRGVARELAAQGVGLNLQVQAGNKRAIAIDFSQPAGREAFLRLVDRADVLVENYQPGALARLDLAPQELRTRNSRLIVCSLSGFGQEDPRGAYDNVIQAACGVMAATGSPEKPVKTAASMIDYFTGMSAAFAIAAALRQRDATGVGQHLDCAMFDCALALMAPEVSAARYSGPDRAETGREAGLQTYDTAQGKLTLGAFTPQQNRRLWEYLGDPDLAATSDWEALWAKSDAIRAKLTALFHSRTAAEWEVQLNAVGVPAQRVRTLEEALEVDRPHFLVDVDGVTVPLTPFRMSDGGARRPRPAPAMGRDTDAILAEIGLSDHIAALRASGAVA